MNTETTEERIARLRREYVPHPRETLKREAEAIEAVSDTLRDHVEPVASRRGLLDAEMVPPSTMLWVLADLLHWASELDETQHAVEVAGAVATLLRHTRGRAQEPVEALGGRDALACYRETGEIDPAQSLRDAAKDIEDWIAEGADDQQAKKVIDFQRVRGRQAMHPVSFKGETIYASHPDFRPMEANATVREKVRRCIREAASKKRSGDTPEEERANEAQEVSNSE